MTRHLLSIIILAPSAFVSWLLLPPAISKSAQPYRINLVDKAAEKPSNRPGLQSFSELSRTQIPEDFTAIDEETAINEAAFQTEMVLVEISQAEANNDDADSEEFGEEAFDQEIPSAESGGVLRLNVTGTRNPRPIQITPANVLVIDEAEIDRRLIRDLSDLIRYEPGISVQENLQFGSQGFNIRGIDGNRVLIQVDGIRLPPAFQSGSQSVVGQGFNIGRDYFDLEILRTAEIIRGPASALYGSDALGGAVSYFTLEPSSLLDAAGTNSSTALSAKFDSENSGFVNTVVQANRFGNFDALLAYTRRDSSESANLEDDQEADRNNFLGRFVYRFSDEQSLDFTAEYFGDRTDTITSEENLPLISSTTTAFTEQIDTERSRFSLAYKYDDEFSDSFLNFGQARIYFQDSQTTEENERTLLPFDFVTMRPSSQPALRVSENRFTDRIFGGDVQLRSDFEIGTSEHQLTYGLDVSNTFNNRPRDRTQIDLVTGDRTQSAIPDNFPTKDFPDSNTLRIGAYLQNVIEIPSARLSVIPGIRYDYYDLSVDSDEDFERNGAVAAEFSDGAFSPNLSLVYQPTEQISLYGRYSRGFRAPLFNEVNSGFTNQIFGYRTLPNPDLDAETSNSFELGVRGAYPQFDFGLTGFYNRYDDFIDFQLVDTEVVNGRDFDVFQNVNIDQAETFGIEANAEYRFSPDPHGFSLLSSVAWTIGNDITGGEALSSVDPIEAIAGLRYRAPENRWGTELITTLVGRARGEGFDPEDGQDPFVPNGFALFDLIGYYRLDSDVTFNLGLFNLFNNEYVQYSDVRFLDANEDLFDQRRNRFDQPGFNVSAGVSWTF
ncbi:TonB-dependent hemoglobin/transferrin/lactoferrin family receptor [cf. Phormidesmis sp. LEGE 11477]|uniref:TonB-dependent hemoglobin/transferrin/lactoferrin family receptor n=1 Tax=cf. Phormidesmis sp. LEGE 11477 TaxID=1828680 RepID=UPI00187E52BC|nr:TonB-dependent hemoglobin/transferrin/lactoferrin family receptor [cf. Phormidesmis sp. LEGE 11477]MBE9059539.1 TonB-dependent hemoglobin/transferrin/lactoferrin family receptor [cf. Phormidesmis sp. LEGE 11477]